MSKTTQNFFPWNKKHDNPLLVKGELGHCKVSTFNLPGEQFTYGKPLPRDVEDCRQVTMTWNFHQETRDKDPDRDFKKLNKMCISNGLFKPDQYSKYRSSNDAKVNQSKGKSILPLYIPEEDFRYGKPNRQSTPIKQVVGNQFGYEQEILITDKYKTQSQMNNQFPRLTLRGNKASQLSYQYIQTKLDTIKRQHNVNDLFKLTKFKNVPPRTNTFNLKKKQAPQINVVDTQKIANELANNSQEPQIQQNQPVQQLENIVQQ